MQILETNRLLITEFTITDAPFILALTNTPGWLQFIGDRGIKNTADAENYLINGPMASYARFGHGLYCVTLKENGAAIGMCGIIKRDTLEDRDIGFAFLPEYTGHGYAFEAAAATLHYAKEKLQLQKIVAITLPNNDRSTGLLAKLGLVFERMISFPGNDEVLMLFASR